MSPCDRCDHLCPGAKNDLSSFVAEAGQCEADATFAILGLMLQACSSNPEVAWYIYGDYISLHLGSMTSTYTHS